MSEKKSNPIVYSSEIEKYIKELENIIAPILPNEKKYLSRFISLKVLDENNSINSALKLNYGIDISGNSQINEVINKIKSELSKNGLSFSNLRDSIVATIVSKSQEVREKTCTFSNHKYNMKSRKIDKIITSKKFGIPIMLLFLSIILWITITRC